MAGINKVILVGNMGKDPVIHVFTSGERVANLDLATSYEWKDKNTAEKKEQTEWHHVILYGGLASICERYVKKGDKIYIEGRLKTEKYTDKHNIERYITKVVAEKIQLLTNKGEDSPRQVDGNKIDNWTPSNRFNGMHEFDDIPF